MADRVPTTGAWQTDPQLQRLITAYVAAANDATVPDIRARGRAQYTALKQYVDANRTALGIPNNYYPDVRTLAQAKGGQQSGSSLRDPHQNQWRNLGLIAGALAVPAALAIVAGPAAGGAAVGAGTTAGGGGGFVAGEVAATEAAVYGGGAAAGTASYLRPLLGQGVQAATNLYGQHMANSASADAARIQTEFLEKALEVEKENERYRRSTTEEERGYTRGQRADYLGRLQPYSAAGTAATTRASALLSGSSYQGQAPPASGSGPTVKLADSRGVVRDVPADQAEQYLQQGATRVT